MSDCSVSTLVALVPLYLFVCLSVCLFVSAGFVEERFGKKPLEHPLHRGHADARVMRAWCLSEIGEVEAAFEASGQKDRGPVQPVQPLLVTFQACSSGALYDQASTPRKERKLLAPVPER